jgi:hypothetical protein
VTLVKPPMAELDGMLPLTRINSPSLGALNTSSSTTQSKLLGHI